MYYVVSLAGSNELPKRRHQVLEGLPQLLEREWCHLKMKKKSWVTEKFFKNSTLWYYLRTNVKRICVLINNAIRFHLGRWILINKRKNHTFIRCVRINGLDALPVFAYTFSIGSDQIKRPIIQRNGNHGINAIFGFALIGIFITFDFGTNDNFRSVCIKVKFLYTAVFICDNLPAKGWVSTIKNVSLSVGWRTCKYLKF